jgi:hypothetical protein
MLKKVKILVLTMLVAFSMFEVFPINKSSAIEPATWSIAKYGYTQYYSFGRRLYEPAIYYGLRGKMWIYSGDTLGFEYGYLFPLESNNEVWKLKVKAKVVKGKGKINMRARFAWDEMRSKEIRSNTWIKRAFGFGQNMWIDEGRLSVVSKNGCTVKLTYSVKRAKSRKWKHRSFKIKVKKLT